MNFAAVVIWYNPNDAYIAKSRRLAAQVGHVFIVDNSACDNGAVLGDVENLDYIALLDNRGIAAAQNVGMQAAQDQGYSHVLMMDQDSAFEDDALARLCAGAEPLFETAQAGIVAANIRDTVEDAPYVERKHVIASGNLVSLQAWRAAQGFAEPLFIDAVDHAFCDQVREAGFKVFEIPNAQMAHQVGYPVTGKILGKIRTSSGHGPDRCYYYVRNKLWLARQNGAPMGKLIQFLVRRLTRILWLEDKKLQKLRAYLEGYRDYRRSHLGKRGQTRHVQRLAGSAKP